MKDVFLQTNYTMEKKISCQCIENKTKKNIIKFPITETEKDAVHRPD